MRLSFTAGLVLKTSQNSPKRLPSFTTARGTEAMKAMMVVRANWLPMLPMRSLMPAESMSFLFSWPLKAAKQLAIAAAMSADHAKSSSLHEARVTPPMTGMSASHLALEMVEPYTRVPITAAKAGSADLTIWAKETAPAPRANTEPACAPAAQMPTGSIFLKSSKVILGVGRASGAAHKKAAYTTPTPSCKHEMIIGNPAAPPAAFKASLLVML
mmetsp:Transcript_25575/g.46608  ORF Transcript_25575/g.46608 Transcript_25575/m.46608 type:complete len:214 (+) Transcript_25575:366-1007(+)